MKTIRNMLVTFISLVLTVLLLSANAVAHDGGGSPFSGTLACGSHYTLDLRHRFRVLLRNFNESVDLNIDRLRIYFKDGALAYDSDVPGYLPEGVNGIINSSNSILQPHQTEQYNSEGLFGYDIGQIPPLQQGNVQIVIEWSATTANAAPLSVGTVRHLYDQNLSNMPIARSAGRCEYLP